MHCIVITDGNIYHSNIRINIHLIRAFFYEYCECMTDLQFVADSFRELPYRICTHTKSAIASSCTRNVRKKCDNVRMHWKDRCRTCTRIYGRMCEWLGLLGLVSFSECTFECMQFCHCNSLLSPLRLLSRLPVATLVVAIRMNWNKWACDCSDTKCLLQRYARHR